MIIRPYCSGALTRLMLLCYALLFAGFGLELSHATLHSPLGATQATTASGVRLPIDLHQPYDRDGSSQQNPLVIQEQGLSEDVPLQEGAYPESYSAVLDALEIMESHYFEVSHGTWPKAIDWTAAVMGTQVSATLAAMSEYTAANPSPSLEQARDHENLLNRYFTQITSFYFGENAFSLRTQAYDDMLWVVLGWLEAIKFIDLHSHLHDSASDLRNTSEWYARQFIPQYSHRARLFYDLASRGWSTDLCGGGMTWNPYLAPYKNAITNQLYISASMAMYLHFPGDSNSSPFLKGSHLPPAKAHDVRYLDNAVKAYKWLKGSGMRNEQGLYVDGFHIKGWRGGKNGSNGTGNCDLRDDKVYTYNQGVLLSGLRDLWLATSDRSYLQDGHELVQNVITATGWTDKNTDRYDKVHRSWDDLSVVEGPHREDINDRGRGRTVETQSGGLAVLRALWKLVESRREG
ncbi:hypothetical protein P7C71_g271, partial [Lecanoromycetidae sp. Uapishka_2]